ncbi:MAG: pyridoxal phosphate-dependent aminotransferase [Ardenticatenaceae bacterium]|nr:pyridoxal phosphate-dependent aminotransferase [Ardenticatenaceae bacterium]MCB9442886.1 pyridoxal phosphate-dependent aminotransferase [Ardenticatenaceae bacterium]
MTFNFDQEIDRKGTNSIKWELEPQDYDMQQNPDAGRLLPLWVADMDFAVPPAVVDALVKRAEHGLFGYSMPMDSYYETVIDWHKRRYGRSLAKEWIVLTPGVVPALNMIVQSFIQPGDKVLIQRPVYYPFFSAIENHGGEIVSNNLVYANGRYTMDFADLAQKTADPAVKMAILCSPHNPVGRVWTADELRQFGQICLENNVLVVSDEIHCDLIMPGHNFTSFASISAEFEQKSIVCTAPSKTFNLAGLHTSNIIIPDEEMRERVKQTMDKQRMPGANPFGLAATEAAYKHGEEWLTAVIDYIADNNKFVAAYLAEHLPQLRPIPLEGTYLLWIDCHGLELDPAARRQLLLNQAHIFLDAGEWFGPEGEMFERVNLACPRSVLVEMLERVVTAVQQKSG